MPLSALAYHLKTGYDRHEMGGRGLDWANQPAVFKTYPGLDIFPLAQAPEQPDQDLYSVIRACPAPESAMGMTLVRLSRIIQLTHCVTAKARHGGTDFYYRNVASAGALYPFELYVGVQGVTGIEDGLYHHTLGLGGLTSLRLGSVMSVLTHAFQTRAGRPLSLVFFLTSIFFRSSWKYGERAYRYVLLDTGHLAESLSLALKVHNLAFGFHYDFEDEFVNRLLAVDARREGCLALACVTGKGDSAPGKMQMPEKTASNLAEASQASAHETEYGLIGHIHEISSTAVERPSDIPEMQDHLGLVVERPQAIWVPDGWSQTMPYPEAVFKRRSKRNFLPTQLCAADFGRLLKLVCLPCDEGQRGQSAGRNAVSVGFLAGNVEGLKAGFYLLARKARSVSLVFEGLLTTQMARVCLEQAWLANSALHFVFLTNLERLEATWGPRGYRYAMLTAGRLGQRIYLGATSLGLGCCGIGAFYDKEAARLLRVNAATEMLYLVAVGPVKR